MKTHIELTLRDIVYSLLLASIIVVGGHAWYHQKQEINELQDKVNYVLRFTQSLHFAIPQQ